MQISPRYDGDPAITMAVGPDQVKGPFVRQRRRLADTLGSLSPEQWAAPTRCEEWTVQDVVSHLVSVDSYWLMSLEAGRNGSPTRFLEGFDPKATPAALVEGHRDTPVSETLQRFRAGVEKTAALVESLSDDEWQAAAESPPGHVAITAVVHHALWDAWTHERDILIPLGLPPVEEDDEVLACLRYVAALGPSFALTTRPDVKGTLVLEVTDPDARIVVTKSDSVHVEDGDALGDLVLRGRAVDIVEALTQRGPLDCDVEPSLDWMVSGLREVFEVG